MISVPALRIGRERAMMKGVPLSENEQRILRQIEDELQQDPTFAQKGYRVPRRRSLLLVLGLLLGLAITIGGLAVSFVLAFAGFVLVSGHGSHARIRAPPGRARPARAVTDLGLAQRQPPAGLPRQRGLLNEALASALTTAG